MNLPDSSGTMPHPVTSTVGAPSHWVTRFGVMFRSQGPVLDLACGSGRHARWFAARGHTVEAVDRDPAALAGLAGVSGVNTRVADLEGGPWPYYGRAFDGVVVTNYLFRPLLPLLFNLLSDDGVMIYETFMVGNERFGKPSNPAFLLRRGELLDLVRNRFTVVAFEQGEVDAPRPAMIQRICLTRRGTPRLPLGDSA